MIGDWGTCHKSIKYILIGDSEDLRTGAPNFVSSFEVRLTRLKASKYPDGMVFSVLELLVKMTNLDCFLVTNGLSILHLTWD